MKKCIHVYLSLTAGFFLLISGSPVSLFAQETDSSEFTLEEITVTAAKRAQDVQKTAISVTALTGSDIREKAIADIEGTLTNMAGVVLNLTTPAGTGVYIRGIGSNVNTSAADPSVQMNLDGVYVGRAEIAFNAVYDIERVEVLRGPQGTLYGRNAIGGAVNLLTKRPTDKFEGETNLRIGTYNLKHIDTMLNIPISEKVSSRLVIMKEDRDSYFKPEGDSSDKFGARAKISYKPTENLSFLFTAEYSHDRSLDRPQVPLEGSAGNLKQGPMGPYTKPDVNNDGVADDFLDADLNVTALGPDGWPVGDGIPDIMQTGWLIPNGGDAWTNDEWHTDAPNRDYKFNLFSMEMVWDLPFTTMTFLPSYNDNYRFFSMRNVMFGSSIENPWDYGDYDLTGVAVPMSEKQWTYEVRFQNPEESAFKWLIGYFGMDDKNANEGEPADPTSFNDGDVHMATYPQPVKSWAVFGQATYPVTERFRVTAGARKNTDNQKRKYRYASDDFDSGLLTYENKVSKITWKAGVEFDVNEGSMLYAQINTGFKQGGLNSDIPPTSFDPEYLTAYTIGAKNRFLNNRFQLNAEGYYYDYTGFQLQVAKMYQVLGTGQMDFMYVINSDDAKIYGLETELDWLVTDMDHLSFTGTYMHSEYGNTILPFNPMAGTPPLNLIGGQMANSPTWTFTLGWEHTWMLDGGDSVAAKAFTRMSDQYWATVEKNLIGTLQKRYHMSELTVNYFPASGKWSTGVWVKNLENEAVTMRVMPIYRKFIGEPRTVGMNFTLKY
jgi:iron complex outermembrane recepter protein